MEQSEKRKNLMSQITIPDKEQRNAEKRQSRKADTARLKKIDRR